MTTVAEVSISSPNALTRSTKTAASWLHVVAHLDPKYGGLSAAVPALDSAIAEEGQYSVRLGAFCRPGEQYAPTLKENVELHYFPLGRVDWLKNGRARRQFNELARASVGVHVHGLWQMSTSVAARAARLARKPYLISAHGMLEAWALANKGRKKAIYATLFERANLQGAACLHALTRAEASDYRRFGLKNPIAVIPNGVTIPAETSSQPFLERFPELSGKRLILFLSRIHFKKGLDILSEAWAPVSRKWPEAHLVLAGPDFENTRIEIEKRLAASGATDRVTFTGMLGGELKWSALAASECFVLPSYSEGLSVAVLEAMGMALPVIITEQCNLPEVVAHDCGWTIKPEAQALESALESALRASARERSSIGQNGKRLVASRYSWPAIGRQMTAVYEWLEGGPKPDEVDLQEGTRP